MLEIKYFRSKIFSPAGKPGVKDFNTDPKYKK